jgi:hypothetical protein
VRTSKVVRASEWTTISSCLAFSSRRARARSFYVDQQVALFLSSALRLNIFSA